MSNVAGPRDASAAADALGRLGWDEDWAAAFEALAEPRTIPGRVTRVDRGRARVATPRGPKRPLIGRHELAVGDWVAVRTDHRSEQVAGVLPRRSAIRRQAAGDEAAGQLLVANVDVVFLVVPLESAPNLRRLERALALAHSSGATPVVVLTKADQAEDPDTAVAAVRTVAVDVDVLVTSVVLGQGLSQTRQWTGVRDDGRVPTVALLGASGAGKSTLVNALAGQEVMVTGDVREGDLKGRHTTTHRQLVSLPDGGLLIDTPGLRSVGLWDAAEGLALAFPDIVELAAGCRFNDCGHDGEPDCAVAAAVQDGLLSAERLTAWRTLTAEQADLTARRVSAARARSRRRRR